MVPTVHQHHTTFPLNTSSKSYLHMPWFPSLDSLLPHWLWPVTFNCFPRIPSQSNGPLHWIEPRSFHAGPFLGSGTEQSIPTWTQRGLCIWQPGAACRPGTQLPPGDLSGSSAGHPNVPSYPNFPCMNHGPPHPNPPRTSSPAPTIHPVRASSQAAAWPAPQPSRGSSTCDQVMGQWDNGQM